MTFFHWIRKTKPEEYSKHVYGVIKWTDRVKQFKQEGKYISDYTDYCKSQNVEPNGI